MARPAELPAWMGWDDVWQQAYVPPQYADQFLAAIGVDPAASWRGTGRFSTVPNYPLPGRDDVFVLRSTEKRTELGRNRTPWSIPYGSLRFGVKDSSSHGGLRGALSNFWKSSGETVLKILSFYGQMLGIGAAFGVGPAAAAAGESAAAASSSTAASSEAASVIYLDALEEGLASYTPAYLETAAAVASEPSWWDRLVDAGTEIGKKVIGHEIAQHYAPDADVSTRSAQPGAPGVRFVPYSGQPGDVLGSMLSPAGQKNLLLVGGLGLAAVAVIMVLKK